jgi:Helix-turn-helix domain
MSVRATNHVRRLRGLSAVEKAVSFVVADHDNHKGGGANPSMTTIAEESGIENRETASRVMARLVAYKVIQAPQPSKGRRPSVYFFNYEIANCDSPITVALPRTVTRESQLHFSNRDSEPVENAPTVTREGSNRDSPVTGRVLKGKERKGEAPASPSPLAIRRSSVIETFSEETYLALLKFEEFRKKIRKPLTEHGIELILKRLGELRAQGQDPVKVLEQSIMFGYQGIFPVKEAERAKSFHERRSEKSAQAIDKVLGRLAEAPGSVQRALR